MRNLFLPLIILIVYSSQDAHASTYGLNFSAEFNNTNKADITIEVSQTRRTLRLLDFRAPQDAYQLISGEGSTEHKNGRLVWQPPKTGGKLKYRALIDSKRKTRDGKLVSDAVKRESWAVVRLGDLFPAARIRTVPGATGKSYLALSGPKDWTFETRYGPITDPVALTQATHSFNRPTGWLVAGDIGRRRTQIGDRSVTVAAPKHMSFPRMDILAFLRWTLPEVTRVFTNFPDHLLIAGAPREMWRGGLSGPGSLYIHIDRPLVSENGTSSLIHELIHVGGVHSATGGGDWIVEGLAEYYSLLVLRRSNGISEAQFNKSLDQLDGWAQRGQGKLSHPSAGANTARAVLVLHQLANELAEHGVSLDKVVQGMLKAGEISPTQLAHQTEALLGKPSATLAPYL